MNNVSPDCVAHFLSGSSKHSEIKFGSSLHSLKQPVIPKARNPILDKGKKDMERMGLDEIQNTEFRDFDKPLIQNSQNWFERLYSDIALTICGRD